MTKAFAFDLLEHLLTSGQYQRFFSKVSIKIDNPKLFTEIWQSKQLQYAWLLNFTNRYEPFSELSIRALKSTAKTFGLNLSDEQISMLNEAKLSLDSFPDSERILN